MMTNAAMLNCSCLLIFVINTLKEHSYTLYCMGIVIINYPSNSILYQRALVDYDVGR